MATDFTTQKQGYYADDEGMKKDLFNFMQAHCPALEYEGDREQMEELLYEEFNETLRNESEASVDDVDEVDRVYNDIMYLRDLIKFLDEHPEIVGFTREGLLGYEQH